jgi:UDP-N-acetylglucosamine 3-dehydrogenase
VKIGVIGAGSMGQNHIRVLRNMPEVDEIIIADNNQSNLDQARKKFGIDKAFEDYEILIQQRPDGIIVATPPVTHRKIALSAIEAGINVLVEKPIAHNLADAEEMILAAERKGIVFTVGHVERFNPVITKIKEFLDNKFLDNIYIINTYRCGPFPKRLLGNTEGVLIDLAVHDLDIINYLGGKVNNIHSQVIKAGKQEIYVKAIMDLENGIKASSEFSWISPRYKRTIEIFGNSGMLLGDYFNQEVTFYENSDFDYRSSLTNESFLGYGLVTAGKIIKYPMYKQEPLLLELTNFVQAIKGVSKVFINPREALYVLENALLINP